MKKFIHQFHGNVRKIFSLRFSGNFLLFLKMQKLNGNISKAEIDLGKFLEKFKAN